jgi:hypothetical protein
MKLDKPKFAVVLPNSYDFAFIEEIDYETEKTFGKRGTTFDAVRYSKSTCEQYHKNTCRWYICCLHYNHIKIKL